MLAQSIIRVGEPIVKSSLPGHERLRWLTDCDLVNCKNFFQNVFLIEINGDELSYHFMRIGSGEGKEFKVNEMRNNAYPIIYPRGGSPLNPQGFYPAPCYLMYDRHINSMNDQKKFAEKILFPRLKKTISYIEYDEEKLMSIAIRVAEAMALHYEAFITDEKQLGILYVYDHSLDVFNTSTEIIKDDENLWITESQIKEGQNLHLQINKCLDNIVQARFLESKTLGCQKNAISTFTNKEEDEVTSIYSKLWLWLSPTWEMPRSIYWDKDDWTPGIKIDRKNFEYYLYGIQFLNKITVPISSSITKEMFAPVMNIEAKKHMKPTSFEQIYGIPIVLPLISVNSEQNYNKYKQILEDDKNKTDSDIHLELIAGINKVIPKINDEYRLTLLYYSGDLSRGNMHIRMMIEDVVPSVAMSLEKIIKNINSKYIPNIRKEFNSKDENPFFRTSSLPSMLSNAYGSGYVWNSLQKVFNRQSISIERLYGLTASKLTELANKEDYWRMVDELILHNAFIVFFKEYNSQVLKIEKEVKSMADWSNLSELYYVGEISIEDISTAEELGFVSGLLLKQFSNSYHHKTGKDFVKHRVMKFGSKLTPEMIWKNGILRCEELGAQWDLGLAGNFYKVLSHTLLATLDADKEKLLTKDKDKYMTAFWSGYLMYRKPKEEE